MSLTIRKFASQILAVPWVYRLFQDLVGGTSSRHKVIRDYVRPSPGDRILDIGCGPGNMVSFFPGTCYVGFDSNPEYIAAARSRFGDSATFICGQVNTFALDTGQRSSFNLVLAFGVLHHLDDDEASQLFKLASSALKPGGRLFTLDGCYEKSQSLVARRLLSWDRGRHVRSQPEYVQLAAQFFQSVSANIHHDLFTIPYTLLVMECARSSS